LNPNDPDNFTRWANGGENIPFNPDQGGLGFLDDTEALELTKEAFQVWTDVPTATATYHDQGPLPFDVDETNYGPLYENIFGIPDGLSPIVYDEDGAIFTDLFGSPDFVFGFAGFDALDGNGVPIEGFAFLNGGVLLSGLLTVEDLRGVMVHEFGHYSGMAHAATNGQVIVFGDTSGPEPDDRFGPAPTSELETMYPIWVEGAGWASLHADDIAFFSTLYPTVDFSASTGTLTGTIYAPNATTPVSGVNVVARNPSNPFADAVSAISGDRGDPGVYTLNGLTPGAEYVVYVDQLFFGRLLPGPEEWHSGGSESNHEEPDTVVSVSAEAGETAVGVDVIFESPRPGLPFPLPLGNDGTIELYPPFVFEFCGKGYESVFVNANGFLTFGSPDTGCSACDSPEGLLNGPPRIAPLWRDLNPDSAGQVTYEQTESSFTVSWTGVPTFPDFGSNSFSVTLSRADNHIDMSYAELTPEGFSPGVSGVSCGGGETSGTEPMTDLTSVAPRRLNLKHEPAIYEGFEFDWLSGASTVDLANSTIGYNGTTGFDDSWSEPNDSFSKARAVHVPFSSADVDRYTAIEPAGSDLDFFRFAANAGDVLNVEVTNGRIDSVLCLFAPDGTLIAQNNDSTGLLSQLVVPIASSGEYRAAVSTFPDLECSTGGSLDPHFGEGRYVLTIGHREPLASGALLGSTGAGGDSLVLIDPTTGSTERVASLGSFGPVTEIDFREDGVLFGSTGDGAIITIDTLTGMQSLIGFDVDGVVPGLEFALGEPAKEGAGRATTLTGTPPRPLAYAAFGSASLGDEA
jgi:hypothetical protein